DLGELVKFRRRGPTRERRSRTLTDHALFDPLELHLARECRGVADALERREVGSFRREHWCRRFPEAQRLHALKDSLGLSARDSQQLRLHAAARREYESDG